MEAHYKPEHFSMKKIVLGTFASHNLFVHTAALPGGIQKPYTRYNHLINFIHE